MSPPQIYPLSVISLLISGLTDDGLLLLYVSMDVTQEVAPDTLAGQVIIRKKKDAIAYAFSAGKTEDRQALILWTDGSANPRRRWEAAGAAVVYKQDPLDVGWIEHGFAVRGYRGIAEVELAAIKQAEDCIAQNPVLTGGPGRQDLLRLPERIALDPRVPPSTDV